MEIGLAHGGIISPRTPTTDGSAIRDCPLLPSNPDGITSIACEFSATPGMPETFLIEVALKPEEKST